MSCAVAGGKPPEKQLATESKQVQSIAESCPTTRTDILQGSWLEW